MIPFTLQSWPRAIAHIDADAFFAAVEQALNPNLRGKPVITGAERGIVVAASYEAKALGIKRGVSLSEATQICPQLILLPSDYETYSIFSKRIFTILRRFSPVVEEYSIDEAFVDLTGTRRLHHMDYTSIGAKMQETIERELGITVSIGISLSKSLAKLCSKFRKPNGLTTVKGRHIHHLLRVTPLEKIWGCGPNTTALLHKHGLTTAFDFVKQPLEWAEDLLGKVGRELWLELRGDAVWPVNPQEKKKQASISKTKTFTPASADREYVKARSLRNLESACIKARRYHQAAKRLILILRTQEFDLTTLEMKLPHPSHSPTEIAPAFLALFDQLFRHGTRYRATGVVLADLVEAASFQFGLFEPPRQHLDNEKLFAAVDQVAARYGKHTLFLADGLRFEPQYSTRLRHASFLIAKNSPSSQKKLPRQGGLERGRRSLSPPHLHHPLRADDR